MHTHEEKHQTLAGAHIKDFIYGANDGIITTFAIVTGAAGADFSPLVVIVLGLANLLADGFSMAASNYLGSSSEDELFREEEKREIQEVEEKPEVEKDEVRRVFKDFDFDGEKIENMTQIISTNKKFWVDFMMRYEIGMMPGESRHLWSATVTFFAFVFIGSLPLLPFIFVSFSDNTIIYSVAATACALFVTGSLRSIFTKKHWFVSGMEMFLVGGIAASVSYFVGFGLHFVTG